MSPVTLPHSHLRTLQREHGLILLHPQEFAVFSAKGQFLLPQRHADHFARVLRRERTWNALVGDGNGRLIHAKVDNGTLHVSEGAYAISRNTGRVKLIQAWVKQKALAVILQKCAELGVEEIVLVDTQNSAPHSEKLTRMETILENSCMQAYNPIKPLISLSTSLSSINLAKDAAFFGDIESSLQFDKVALQAGTSTCFINGPEGGWNNNERQILIVQATGVLLSENVLRAETAAIIAMGLLKLKI